MEKLNAVFAGFRHGHVFSLYERFGSSEKAAVLGAFEDNEQAKAAARERGVVFTADSLDELLSDPAADIVVIGDCYGKRGNIAVKALEAGKHIIADKPLCITLDEAKKIKQLSESRNLAVGMMLDMRNSKNIITAREAVRSGLIGKVNNIVFEAQHPLNFGTRPAWYFEKGMHGGTVNDIAVHGIDIIRSFTGADVGEIIGARTWNFYADKCPDFKDSAQLMLKMTDGTGAIGDVSYAAPGGQGYSLPSYWHFRVWGSLGMLDFSLGSQGVTAYLSNEKESITLPQSETEYDYFEDFIKAVKDEEYRKAYTENIMKTTFQVLEIQKKAEEKTK